MIAAGQWVRLEAPRDLREARAALDELLLVLHEERRALRRADARALEVLGETKDALVARLGAILARAPQTPSPSTRLEVHLLREAVGHLLEELRRLTP